MHGQYLMNKEISVQYAYKKDGKGERHGDQAERMLAAQAQKHNVQPQITPMPAPVAMPPAMMMNGGPNGNYQNVPPPQQGRPAAPAAPLGAPPPGLPARPPPSQAGYGGPAGFMPQGFNNMPPQGFPQQGAGPPGFAPPPGFGPPAAAGNGPPPMPPGFTPSYRR